MGAIYGLHAADGRIRYIGQTSGDVRTRFYQHKTNAKLAKLPFALYKWMRKHGIENIKYRILEEVPDDALNPAEIEWIAALREMGFYLLNHSSGGAAQRGFKHTPEARAKMSASKVGKRTGSDNHAWGKPKSQNVRDKISASKTGKPWSNKRRAVAKPRRGEENNLARLTEAQVLSIHERANSGGNWKQICDEYGIGVSHYYRIKNKQIWTHLWGES